ncbi:MAG: DUF805 domain-containing protein [Microbacteriaceae bacterium]
MTFVDAVATGFRKVTTFTGTATRPEFWYWILFIFLVRLVTVTIDAFVYPEDLNLGTEPATLDEMVSEMATAVQHSLWSVTFAVELLLLLPTISVTMRRFRDSGWKPWFALSAYIGNYGSVALSLIAASALLADLTANGIDDIDATALIVGAGVIVVAALLEFASLLVIVIGGSQPSRVTAPTAD